MTKRVLRFTVGFIGAVLALAGCENPTAATDSNVQSVEWVWTAGSGTASLSGLYGRKGVANSANLPGGRSGAVSWTDASGNLWLFSGSGLDSEGSSGYLNDRWMFDGNAWTWVAGGTTVNQSGTHGTKGVASVTNVPGARANAVTWSDANGNLWLFGGSGYDGTGTLGLLNDLWLFDGTAWTWVSGSSERNQFGSYGTKGVGNAANVPGARDGAASWSDANGNLWLFGGLGYGSGVYGYLNDLWVSDGSAWTWVSGSDLTARAGTYGTKSVPDADNAPGARSGAMSWSDASGNLWLFGGSGHDGTGSFGYLNDLWVFDGNAWTWVSGSSTRDGSGTYGTKGETDAANVPRARSSAMTWSDANGNLWLFGGFSRQDGGLIGRLNDLWRYDGDAWTWVAGSSEFNKPGAYSTKGVANATNVPGARTSAMTWSDANGNLWLFGGSGYDAAGSWGSLSDLWRFRP